MGSSEFGLSREMLTLLGVCPVLVAHRLRLDSPGLSCFEALAAPVACRRPFRGIAQSDPEFGGELLRSRLANGHVRGTGPEGRVANFPSIAGTSQRGSIGPYTFS